MIERLILSVVIVVASALVFAIWQIVQKKRLSGVVSADGTPKVLYFRADSCAGCSTQKRFLDEIDAPIETIDVEHEPEKASRFNVMTLPSTIVVNALGEVRHINYGVTNARRLSEQLAAA